MTRQIAKVTQDAEPERIFLTDQLLAGDGGGGDTQAAMSVLALLKKHMATIGASEGSSGAAVTEMRAQVCQTALYGNHCLCCQFSHHLLQNVLIENFLICVLVYRPSHRHRNRIIFHTCHFCAHAGVAGAGLALRLE